MLFRFSWSRFELKIGDFFEGEKWMADKNVSSSSLSSFENKQHKFVFYHIGGRTRTRVSVQFFFFPRCRGRLLKLPPRALLLCRLRRSRAESCRTDVRTSTRARFRRPELNRDGSGGDGKRKRRSPRKRKSLFFAK